MGPPLRDSFLFRLCTGARCLRKPESLTICVHPVQDWPLLWRTEENPRWYSEKPLPMPVAGRSHCETGFRRGFSQLTFFQERAQYQRSGFPTQSKPYAVPVSAGHE
jgi:hypothetical protein